MSPQVRPFEDGDRSAVRRLRYRIFTADRFDGTEDGFYIADDRRVVAALEGRVVGHAGAWQFGQYFGGRRVPMSAVAGVIVEPQVRGAGTASEMVRALIDTTRAQGDVIATLYPAVVAPYRRLGWEFAGTLTAHSLPTRALTAVPAPDRAVTVRPADADDAEAMQQLYVAAATPRDGWFHVDPRWLAYNAGELDDLGEDEWWAAERDGELTGYVLYRRVERDHESPTERRLLVRELIAADRDTERALWRLVGSSWSIWPRTEVRGEVEPTVLHLIDEEDTAPVPRRWERWMTRIIDVPGALEARGYPRGLDASVQLEVQPGPFAQDAGRWVVEVRDGVASVEAGGDGTVVTDVGALSAAYTGFTPASTWRRLGRLQGPDDDVATLDAMFRGPAPTSAHYF